MEKKILIAGQWNSQGEANIIQQDPGHVEHVMKEKDMIPDGLNRQTMLQESPNNSHEKPCQADYIPLWSV